MDESKQLQLGNTKDLESRFRISARTAQHYRTTGQWQRRVHWFMVGTRRVCYNLGLIEDWILNACDRPELHKAAIERFLKSLENPPESPEKPPTHRKRR